MARRVGTEPSFFRFYLGEPYLLGLGIALLACLVIPGDWVIEMLGLATAIVLSTIAAYVNYRVTLRRLRRESSDRTEDETTA